MDLQKLFVNVFFWMAFGLAITFGTGYIVSQNPNMLATVLNKGSLIFIIIIELGLAFALSFFLHKMSPLVARICFIVYAFVTGLTFSSIFVVYKIESIMYVFGITAVLFFIFALVGMFTKANLTKFGTILLMGLLGIIICGVLNLFLKSSGFDFGLCVAGVVLFLTYVAYDVQIIKQNFGKFDDDNLAIYGALQLYLDFINIFIKLLRIMGKNRD